MTGALAACARRHGRDGQALDAVAAAPLQVSNARPDTLELCKQKVNDRKSRLKNKNRFASQVYIIWI